MKVPRVPSIYFRHFACEMIADETLHSYLLSAFPYFMLPFARLNGKCLVTCPTTLIRVYAGLRTPLVASIP